MTNTKWTRTGVTTLLAVSLLGVPAAATAGERCNTRDRASRQAYYGVSNNGNYGSRANRGEYRNYRDYRSTSAYRNDSYRNREYGYAGDPYYGDYRETRSPQKSAVIIGGGAAAGAAVGALSGGAKGAAIGAAVGGVGGLIYDRATKNRGDRYGW
jgi:hypothetical protein